MTISDNLVLLRKEIAEIAKGCQRSPSSIKLLAVSKRHPIGSIEEALEAGQQIFGENYIQEAVEKCKQLSHRAQFHFIGHIQSNKAKQAAEFFSLVETVDRYKLAKSLNGHLDRLGRTLDIMVQVNIGEDPDKSGVPPNDTALLLEKISTLPRIRCQGLMTIPPLCHNAEEARLHFRNMRILSQDLASRKLFADNNRVELSMGMSRDFKTAIEEGATIIRVGTAIFGQRPVTP
jgi:pyridoxal phosphate enzyme (YggS family)